MFNSILTYLKEGSLYYGMEIREINGEESYYLLEVARRKGELHISKTARLSTMDELQGQLKNNTPLFLTINTSRVLTKQLDGSGASDPEVLVNEAFPNLDLDNFYYQITQIDGNPIITISKREHIDGLIQKLGRSSPHLAGFSLGISPFHYISTFLDIGEVSVSNFNLIIDDGQIKEIRPNKEGPERSYHVNGLRIPDHSLLSFSHIYGHLGGFPVLSNFTKRSDSLWSNFYNDRLYYLTLQFSLAFFLIFLMVNFLIFSHYRDQIEDLKSFAAINISDKENLENLEAQVLDKEQRVALLNDGTSSRSTYFLDELGREIPPGILLDQIIYLPLAKPLRDLKPIELVENTILVKGISMDDASYSSWLGTLEKKKWINRVETMDYDYITKESSSFSFQITVHDDQ